MKELSLHILDIAENSVRAEAQNISIDIEENTKSNKLAIRITDDGKGMSTETVAQITDPFTTSRSTRKVGLGIPFFKAAAEACNGFFRIHSSLGKGTNVEAEFQLDHIDRMPMGDIQNTILNLFVGYPDVRWLFSYDIDGKVFSLDSKPIKEVLEDVPLSDPIVISYLRDKINDGIQKIKKSV